MSYKELSLEEIQQKSFEILKVIKQICDKNNFKYYLMYGTLLGAVRHGGFIPWDDDIDIMMPRCDYEKFINYCIEHSNELKPLELIHYKTNLNYIYPIARLSDSRYINKYSNTKDYGLGLFVDIYPFDGANDLDKKYNNKLYKKARNIISYGKIKFVKSNTLIKTIGKYIVFCLLKFKNINKLLKKIDLDAQKYSYDECEYVQCMVWNINRNKSIPKKLIEDKNEINRIKFNGILFNVPNNYKEVLKILYGDYMKLPPENERIGHHYYSIYRK